MKQIVSIAAILYIITIFVAGTFTVVSAFHTPQRCVSNPRTETLHVVSRSRRHSSAVSIDNDGSISGGASVMEGTSPKAIKLRKEVQAVLNDPSNTSPIICEL
jgi:hypothetical protein